MKPATGGRTIALIGADGSGKSTIAAELTDWLGWKLQVRAYYMGSKEPSIASRWSYTAFRACRRGSRGVARRLGPSFAAPLSASRDILLALHHLSIARDRRRRHRMAGRDVRSGRIVVFDRYPLEAVGNDRQHRLLDGPQIASALEGSMGRLTRALARIEERGYRAFGLPDHLVVLNVDPVIAVDRKPDHLPELLAAKSQAVIELARFAELRHPEVDVINVDASRPLEEVLTEVRSKVWDVF
jgi:ABC-type dipeptide/oligopeptide/nickel transport system ATPase component